MAQFEDAIRWEKERIVKLHRVRRKGTKKYFLAYLAIDPWSQEATWYRPWKWWRWSGETAYWKDEIEWPECLKSENN